MAMANPNHSRQCHKGHNNMVRTNSHNRLMVESNELSTVIALARAKGVDVLADKKGNLIARNVHAKLLDFVLQDTKRKYFELGIKSIIASEATKHMPLATAMAQFAVSVKMDNDLGFRLGGVVFNLLKQAGLMTEYMRETENGRSERVMKLPKKWAIDKDMLDELLLHVSPGAKPFRPKDWIVKADGTLQVGGYASTKMVMGSRLNAQIVQSQRMYDILNHEQRTAYAVDWDVWNKFRDDFQDSFPADQSWVEITKLEAELNILGIDPAFFARAFGSNGRIYILGYRTHREAGIRNELFQFHTKKLWNKEDYHTVERQIDGLRGSTSAKEIIQLYVLERDLALQQAGTPTGTIIRRDAKMSGVQGTGAVAMRSKEDAYHCGMLETYKDGRLVISANPLMTQYGITTKAQAKAGAMTWMYLSGGKAMITKIKEDTGLTIKADGKTFKGHWDESAKEVFPGQVRLMKELMGIIQYKKKETQFNWTLASGFKASIRAIGTVETVINTVMGKHSFSRQEIDKEFMGVRLGAAFGHGNDATLRHWMVLTAKRDGIDIDIVHDQFGVHLVDSVDTDTAYVSGLRRMLDLPILENFMQDVAGNGARANKVMINTLSRFDIVGGLFD